MQGRKADEPDNDIHPNYILQLLPSPLSLMLLAYMLEDAIPSGEAGLAPFYRAPNPEIFGVDSKVLPRGVPTALGEPAVIPLTNLPVTTAMRPVNAKYMVFPCVLARQSETAAAEWTKGRLLRPPFYTTSADEGLILWARVVSRGLFFVGGTVVGVPVGPGGEYSRAKPPAVGGGCGEATRRYVAF